MVALQITNSNMWILMVIVLKILLRCFNMKTLPGKKKRLEAIWVLYSDFA